MPDETLARVRVAAGVALLDVRWPGWRGLVDSRLDMAQGWHDPHADDCGCVVSQYDAVQRDRCDGDFYYGVRLLRAGLMGLPWTHADRDGNLSAWAIDHGFVCETDEGTAESDAEYALLTRLWREELDREGVMVGG